MMKVCWLVAVMVCVLGGEAWAGALIPPKDADTCTDGTGALAWVETGASKDLVCVKVGRGIENKTCPAGQILSYVNKGTITCVALDPLLTSEECPAGKVAIALTDGKPTCVGNPLDVSCPSGQFMRAFSAEGAPVCVAQSFANFECAGGTVLAGISVAGVPQCIASGSAPTVSCPDGQVMKGLSAGAAVCETP